MIARRTPRPLAPLCLLVLSAALLLAPRALLAQDDPTPFWIADTPQSGSKEPVKKKETKPKKEAKPKAEARPRDDFEEPAPAPKKSRRKAEPARAPEEEYPPPAPKKRRYEALPPLPHIEPELPPRETSAPPSRAPIMPGQRSPQTPGQPQPSQTYAPPPSLPAYPTPAPQAVPSTPPTRTPARQAPLPAPAPQPASRDAAPYTYPAPPAYAPPPSPPPARPAGPTVVPLDERRANAPGVQPDEPEDDSRPRFRRFSLELLGGAWGKATSEQARSWQLAYGADLGVGLFRFLQLDVRGLRASGTDGNSYVNASTSHLLLDARLLGMINFGRDKFALYGGGGGGLAFEQTQLFLQDVGGAPTTLSSSGVESVGEAVLGLRARPWKGLTLRLELDALVRQGNFEPLLLLGAGWAL